MRVRKRTFASGLQTNGATMPASQTGASSGFITAIWFAMKAIAGTRAFFAPAAPTSSRKGQSREYLATRGMASAMRTAIPRPAHSASAQTPRGAVV